MRRREFIVFFGGAAVTAPITTPLAAQVQQAENPVRIGLVPIGSPSNQKDLALVDAFKRGLREAGVIENRHVAIDIAWVSDESQFPQVIRELIERGVKLLVPAGTSAAVAAKRATATIPVVFITVGDPIGVGLIESLAHPGGNVTGFSDVLLDLSSKYVDLARQVGKPQATAIDYLWYAGWANGPQRFQATERAAQSVGVELRSRALREIAEAKEIIAEMKKLGAVALIIQPGPFTYRHRKRLIDTGLDQGVATIFAWPDASREGALIGYGPDYTDMYRRAASYVARILKGMNPADLPVEQPSKFQLVLNLKTARILDLEIPPMLLAIADEAIE